MGLIVSGRAVVPGEATGIVLRSRRAISLWGGVDPETGKIIDPRHDRCGASLAGRVFVYPGEKGSSTGSAVLLELVRRGLAPAALVTGSLAPVAALGSIVAEELYGKAVPVLLVARDDLDLLKDGDHVCIGSDGTVRHG